MAEEKDTVITTLRHFRSADGRGPKQMVLERVSPGTDSAQFLRRMEQRRRDLPERRAIDLRKRLGDRQCHEYEYAGITHHLDKSAQSALEQALEQNDGRYTVGVYEDVTETTATLHSRMEAMRTGRLRRRDSTGQVVSLANPLDADSERDDQLEVIPFGFFTERCEQRMNYVVDVELVLPDGDVAHARTVDLSPRGLRVRCKSLYGFKPGDVIGVRFVAFGQRFDGDFEQPYGYSVAEVDPRESYTLLRLSLENPDGQGFITGFLQEFIADNSHRYKYDTGDEEQNATAKAFERYYLQGLQHVPFFIAESDDGRSLNADCLLRSEQNARALEVLENRLGSYELERLLPQDSLAGLVERSVAGQTSHVFLLTMQRDGRRFHLRVFDHALKDEQQRRHLFALGQLPDSSLRAWRIDLQAVELERDQELVSAVASLSERSGPVAERLSDRIRRLRWLGRLTEVSTALVPDRMPIEAGVTVDQHLQALAAFRLDDFDIEPLASVEHLPISYLAQRKHPRYSLRSGLKMGAGEVVTRAQMTNFSEDGMQVQTETRLDVSLGDRVEISFEEMYNRVKRPELIRVPFDVVGGDPHSRTLRLASVENDNKARKTKAFLHSVIERNRDRLNESTDETAQVAYIRMIERLLVTSIVSVPFFIGQDEQYHVYVRYIGVSESSSPLLWFFRTEDDQYDLAMIIQDANIRSLVREGSLFEPRQAKAVDTVLYLYKDVDSNTGDERVAGRMESDLAEPAERSNLIRRARESYDFRFVQLSVSAVGELMPGELDARFAAIRRSNPHHYKNLRERLAQVIGLGDLVDVTEEVLAREQWQEG